MRGEQGGTTKGAATVGGRALDGLALREMFAAGAKWLEHQVEAINALNVFPVPDGDTGTNMLLTMRTTLEQAYGCAEEDVPAIAQAMAQGALLGARGNSGVILSQMLRGLAKGLEGKTTCSAEDLAQALAAAAEAGYRGVVAPVEGTMLTVMREAAQAGQEAAGKGQQDVVGVLACTVDGARASLARTPDLLPVLRAAGVVDAGGQGLLAILEGALRYLRGEPVEMEAAAYGSLGTIDSTWLAAARQPHRADEPLYGYCTEFLLQGQDLDLEAIKEKTTSLGISTLVVGDEHAIRVHLHTFEPGTAISFGTALGTLLQVKVENMEIQHQEFLRAHAALALAQGVAVVTVVSGDGLAQVFRSLGARAIVPGGQTMNPSAQELVQAAETCGAPEVILLPNNPNIVLTARQAVTLLKKKAAVVPSQNIPQGIAAMLALNPESELEANVAAMTRALTSVRAGEVTIATRDVQLGGVSVRVGKPIGLLDGELVAAGDTVLEVVLHLLERAQTKAGNLVTFYSGAATQQDAAEELVSALRSQSPDVEFELVRGGQPHYPYLLSIE